MRLKTLFYLWLPLAVSFELMMLEGPAVQGAIGRLIRPDLNLAAFGLTFQLSLLIESPVIMLLATAIALVKGGDSFRAVRKFTVNLAGICTILTAAIAFTPLFDIVTLSIMHMPPLIVETARIPLRIMLLWSAAIGWRRFYQGVIVMSGETRLVSLGTVVRLGATVLTAIALAKWGGLTGAAVGACALMAGVVSEAFATTAFATPLVRSRILSSKTENGALSQRAILQFHAPLMATTLLTLLAQPMTSAALARLAHPERTLAAGPVTFVLLLVMRGWGLALQEITVAQARHVNARETLRQFTWIVGVASTAATAVVVFTPLLDIYLGKVIHVRPHLYEFVRIGVVTGIALPFLTSLSSWARGVLLYAGRTKAIYRGMGINLVIHGGLLAAGVSLKLPGMPLAFGSFTIAAMAEYVFLARVVRGSLDSEAPVAEPVLAERDLCAAID